MNTLRRFTRLFAIPLIILGWFFELLQTFIIFLICLCDLIPDEFDFCIDGLFGLLKNYIKDGMDGI